MQGLIHLAYHSQISVRGAHLLALELRNILRVSIGNNVRRGVTGALMMYAGSFIQVLEGERTAVTELYSKIAADRRHSKARLMVMEPVTERRFASAPMTVCNPEGAPLPVPIILDEIKIAELLTIMEATARL